MKKQILPDGTIVLEGSPEEIYLLESEVLEDETGNEGFLEDLVIHPQVRPRSWQEAADNRRFGWGTPPGAGEWRTPENLSRQELVREIQRMEVELQNIREDNNDRSARRDRTEVDLRQEARFVADKWQAEERKVAKLERQLAKAVEQGFDPEKKEPFKTEIVTEKGTTIYFKVLRAGRHQGLVAQYYKGGNYLHNQDPDLDEYLENYVAAGVDVDDRVHPWPDSGYSLVAASESMPRALEGIDPTAAVIDAALENGEDLSKVLKKVSVTRLIG